MMNLIHRVLTRILLTRIATEVANLVCQWYNSALVHQRVHDMNMVLLEECPSSDWPLGDVSSAGSARGRRRRAPRLAPRVLAERAHVDGVALLRQAAQLASASRQAARAPDVLVDDGHATPPWPVLVR